MTKCMRCAARGRAANDDAYCIQCRRLVNAELNQPINPVPVDAVCHKHPSARAHWIASRPDSDLTMTLCGHCRRVEGKNLEDAGWTLAGKDLACNCGHCA